MPKEIIKRNKKRFIIIAFILFILALIGIGFIYYLLFGFEEKNNISNNIRRQITNPAKSLSLEEAIKLFDEDFVLYLLFSIKAYNLHEPLFGSDIPKIELHIEEDIYNARIIDGKINVERGEIDEEDIIITTSKEEAVKIMLDKDYVVDSFRSGLSNIELSANKLELASKGYLSIYEELKEKN